MGNAAAALALALQSMQFVQEVKQLLDKAAADGNRDLTEDELNGLKAKYTSVRSDVDAFLTSKGL
jgi:hypothetical protein